MKTFLYLVMIAFFFGCSGAPKPVALENSAKISINQGLLTEYNNEVPKDPLLSGNNWAYNLTARKQSDGELLKNSEVTKMFYFAHNADKIIIIGSRGIAKEYQDYFIQNAVTALIEIQPVTDIKLKNNGVNILFFGNGKEKTITKKAPVVHQEEPIILHAEEKSTFATQAPLEITEVVTPIESPKVEMSQPKQSLHVEDKPKIEEKKPTNTPQKPTIKNLALKEQKPLVVIENNTTIAPQEPQKETKTPLAMVEEVKPIETPKIEAPTVDKNTSSDPKVIAAVDQLKSEPSVMQNDNKTIKNDTKIDVNETKIINNDMNDTKSVKTDTKPKIEMVIVKDRPFDLDPTPNNTVAKELTLVEIIEEALAVYPNIDEKKLREDLMRLVVKNPNIDAEAVRTMPLKKSLLLELLKVAKEKQ